MFNKFRKTTALSITIITILSILFANIFISKVYATTGYMAGASSSDGNTSPGDQSGTEVYVKSWNPHPWHFILRYKNNDKAKEKAVRTNIVNLAIQATNNSCIGYDMNSRGQFLNEISKVNYDLNKLTTKCNCDCGSFVDTIVIITGHKLNISAFQSIAWLPATPGMYSAYTAMGFKAYSDSKYLTGTGSLIPGDILVNRNAGAAGHTEIYIGTSTSGSSTSGGGNGEDDSDYESDGDNDNGDSDDSESGSYVIGPGGIVLYGMSSSWKPSEIDEDKINLDDFDWAFAGSPKHVTYYGKKKKKIWIFDKLKEFLSYIVGLIVNGAKYSIMGYGMAFESMIDKVIKRLEGVKVED